MLGYRNCPPSSPDLPQPLLGQEQGKNSQEEDGAWKSELFHFFKSQIPYTESEEVGLPCFPFFK